MDDSPQASRTHEITFHTDDGALFLTFVVLFILAQILSGCALLSGPNQPRIVRDTTYATAGSPYEARVKIVSSEHRDTSTTELSNGTFKKVTVTERCIYQRVTLQAKNMLHRGRPFSYVRVQERECDPPPGVRWTTKTLRGDTDQKMWISNRKKRRRALGWIEHYLSKMYLDFPMVRHIRR